MGRNKDHIVGAECEESWVCESTSIRTKWAKQGNLYWMKVSQPHEVLLLNIRGVDLKNMENIHVHEVDIQRSGVDWPLSAG